MKIKVSFRCLGCLNQIPLNFELDLLESRVIVGLCLICGSRFNLGRVTKVGDTLMGDTSTQLILD